MSGQHFIHLAKDEQASALRLGQGFAHDLRGDAADLDIHLQRGDALFGPCDLEVHIAVVIFGAGNIRQDGIIIAFLYQAHRDARDWSLERNTGIHERKCSAADGSHRRRPIGFKNVGDDSHCIGPVFFGGEDRRNCPFS